MAAADAQGGQAASHAAPRHLVQERDRDAHAGRSDGMAQGDRAAVDVDPLRTYPQLAIAGQDLGREGFVHLHEIEILETKADLLEQAAYGGGDARSPPPPG